MTKENLVKAPARRVKRNPVEGKNILKVTGTDPNYEYRVVNDDGDRVEQFIDVGWEHAVEDSIRVGDSRVDETSRLGKVRVLSVGGGKKAVLLKIKKDWYDEDQAAKQEYVKHTEAAMRPDTNDGGYGKVKFSRE